MSTELAEAETPRAAPAIHPGQWRLDRVELVNWGTFQGHHVIDVARRGFLLTGHSGSGKSSLVDAVTAVLTPGGKIHFNAAAADASSRRADRNIASYVRGAWRRQSDETTGEVVSEYLRTGATWSAVGLRYSNGTADPPVTLIKLAHLRAGANTAADASVLHLLSSEPIDVMELQPYARDGLEIRKIKAAWPQATVTERHSVFAERFCRLLGIGGENALVLLHKTQSAKNLGSLDDLFRGFMLDEPTTFAIADTAVEQFGDLSEAHAHVVTARRQIAHLSMLRPHIGAYDDHLADATRAADLRASLPAFADAWKLELARMEHGNAERQVHSAENSVKTAHDLAREAADAHHRAVLLVSERGGQALANQRDDLERAEHALKLIAVDRASIAGELNDVGIDFPTTFDQFEELRVTARAERARAEEMKAATSDRMLALHETRADVVRRRNSITDELATLKHARSNLDPHLQEARGIVCRLTGISPGALPFAGELLQVRDEYRDWTGAIERALRPLATLMLVPAAHRDAVSHAVDSSHLNARLVIEVVPSRPEPVRPVRGSASLVHRVNVKAGPMRGWLDSELARRYDYDCVDNDTSLHGLERAVTRAGQVKRGHNHYEKDDRTRIDDRRRWVLGFDNAEKVEHLLGLLHETDSELESANAELGRAERERTAAEARASGLRSLERREWKDVDVDSAQGIRDRAQHALDELLAASSDLRNAEAEERRAAKALATARSAEQDAMDDLASARGHLRELVAVIADLAHADATAVPVAHQRELEQRYYKVQRVVRHEIIDRLTLDVGRGLDAVRDTAQQSAATVAQQIVDIQASFRRSWESLASDLTTAVSDRTGYLAILDRLEADRLPDFEEKFFDLLENQSRKNIGQLASIIRRAPGEIREKIGPVNASLLRSPFDQGRYLQIKVDENRTPAVQEFLTDLKDISAGSWSAQDRGQAETRFAVMERVMKRLASSESGDRNWQTLCLDTRRHVRFTGVEIDDDGAQVNIHDSSAGLSGGQRQKLVIFCLAAALRYQLTADGDDIPTYGTVILDEAFDKADTTFTRMAMDVFLEFGFHMILATPLKLLQTLEDYVGGIGLAACKDFKDSSVGLVSIGDLDLAPGGAE